MIKLIDVSFPRPVRSHENRPTNHFRALEGYDIEWEPEAQVIRIRRPKAAFSVVVSQMGADWRIAEELPESKPETPSAKRGKRAPVGAES